MFAALFEVAVLLIAFVGLAIVCDDHMVVALETLCVRWNVREDVAGVPSHCRCCRYAGDLYPFVFGASIGVQGGLGPAAGGSNGNGWIVWREKR